MGGVVPLGYRVENRALHVVEQHAALFDLFRRYLEIGSVVQLKAILDQEDVRLPTRMDGTGKTIGGGLISRVHLYKILSNPIYVGRLTHKGRVHDGLDDPIVDNETWGQVQSLLAEHAQHKKAPRQDSDALLAGKLFDDRGKPDEPEPRDQSRTSMALLCLAGGSAGPQAGCGVRRPRAGNGDRTKGM